MKLSLDDLNKFIESARRADDIFRARIIHLEKLLLDVKQKQQQHIHHFTNVMGKVLDLVQENLDSVD